VYWLRTLGGFGIERDGLLLDRVAAHRKALALLAVLAAQGSTSRERLMLLLWPDADERRAKSSLKQAVHLLRRQLGAPDLILGTPDLRLNPDRITSDVSLFVSALGKGDTETAIHHYGGPFLDGVHLDGTAEFERWAEIRRAELSRSYMESLEQLARAAEERADLATAATWWHRLQVADPLNSRVALNLMLALEKAGDRAAALLHSQAHTAVVLEELGITPDPAVTELADRLRQDLAPVPERRPPAVKPTGPLPRDGQGHNEPGPGDGLAMLGGGTGEASPRTAVRGPARILAAASRPWLALVVLVAMGVVAVALAAFRSSATGKSYADSEPLRAATVGPSGIERGSIAVLPFLDLSPAGDREYFSDGMTEELITALSQVEGLKVAARTSAFQFKGAHPDIRQVGERLRVAHVLAGSVRMAGDSLRITAQLVSAEDGYQLWAESYDTRMLRTSDIFAVQEEISRAIVQTLHDILGTAVGRDVRVAVPTENMAAYEFYLKGLHFLNRLQIAQAIDNLESAIALDPQFARALAALAESHAVPVAYNERWPADSRTRGIAAAEAAIRLDPDLADGHAALGWLQMIGLRWDDADHALRRAVELDPAAPRARQYYALYLHRRDRLDEAMAQLGIARDLDPLSLAINALHGSFIGELGHTEQAVRTLQATLELGPDYPIAHAMLGHLLLDTGSTAEAIRHYEHVATRVPTSVYAGFLGHAYARAGRTADARRVLASLYALEAEGGHVSQGAIGWILLALGEHDDAFRHLDTAATQRDIFLTVYGILSNRHLAGPFRDDPRFRRLRVAVGLEP
jgi:adenylate cyclase